MLQLRPTFSESWYRVVNLKPKLRGTAQISRQYYRGERWYVVRDPAGNQFHRLSDAAYRFVGLLDGRRTVGEAWDLVGGQLADDAPTQPEVIQILSQLYAANLVETDIPPDATVLLRRHKQLQKRQWQGRLMNVLFPRIPIWDPDNFLKRWLPLVRPMFSKIGAIIWLIVVGAAVAAVTPHWTELKSAAADAVNIGGKPENVLLLWCTFVLIKFIHECGHAFACRRFGGEVHEMGIMFLVFIPTPYVDASTAWAFPSKWARMFVGAGGMIVELFFASLCAFIWLNTKDSGTIIAHLSYNAMLIASVTTVIFNANPLLRYDGYYMLSDFLEIPNLQQKSKEYALGIIKRHVFRIKSQQPLPPVVQRIWLFVYAVLSSIYRIFVGVAIVLMVTFQIPVIGILMAVGGLATWLIVPFGKLFKYLTVDPELHRKRGRAWAFTGAVAALVAIVIGLVQFPVRVRAEGVVEPKDKVVLYTKTPGFVIDVKRRDGEMLHKGDAIVVCQDDELTAQIAQTENQLAAARIRYRGAAAVDPTQAKIEASNVSTLENELKANLYRKLDDLTIRAPIDGYLVCPDINQYPGRYFQIGQEIATVQTEKLRLRGALDQPDAQLAMNRENSLTEVRLVSDVQKVWRTDRFTIFSAADMNVPEALTATGGGEVPIDPRDPGAAARAQEEEGRKSASGSTKTARASVSQFELRVDLENPDGKFVPGQRAYVRITLDHKPLAWQWYNSFLQLIQARSSSSKWI